MFKVSQPKELDELLKSVEEGKLQLPDFQRGWVWDDDHICDLLASVSRGFPIGVIMTLDANSEIKFKPRPIEGAEENGAALEGVFAGRSATNHIALSIRLQQQSCRDNK